MVGRLEVTEDDFRWNYSDYCDSRNVFLLSSTKRKKMQTKYDGIVILFHCYFCAFFHLALFT